MILDIRPDMKAIKVKPANELEEIAQNVSCILSTIKGTVPLDRDFGIDASLLDAPINGIQARLTALVASAVNEFEPRARVHILTLEGNADGELDLTVRIEIVEGNLRG